MHLIISHIPSHWLTLHGLIVMIGLAIYVTSSHTLRQRRHPSAAIAWVVTLVLMPYLAMPLYLMFGSRKVVTHRDTTSKLPHRADDISPETIATRTQQLASAMRLSAAAPYRHLNIHRDGTESLQALHNMIDNATKTIDLCTFLFARDKLGDDIARKLIQRAKEGIRIRLIIDGVGAYLGGHRNFKPMSDAGIQVAFFVPPLRSTLRGRTNLRNHRKMLITDGRWLWCGGRNLADEYFEGNAKNADCGTPWVDLSFDLRGQLAIDVHQQFERDWEFATTDRRHGSLMRSDVKPAEPPQGQLIASGPDQVDDTLYVILVSGFFNARKSILIVTPYFVPDPTLLMSLVLAARRGVAVEILLPRISNHRLADQARHRALRELSMAGAHVRLFATMIHAKAVVIDNEVALVGSANMDERSLFLNYELMTAFYEPSDAGQFTQWIRGHFNAATPYVARRPPLWREVLEGLLLWLAFQL